MSAERTNSWQEVQAELRRRITQRDWMPGEFIPFEADLAEEFGCARSTMNRALRSLAEEGLLERKRKAGTRVALNPVRQVRLEISILRKEIEGKGAAFQYMILKRTITAPPADVMARLQTSPGDDHLHIETLYMANQSPYVFEDRWINLSAVPQARAETFDTLSPNEWLVHHVAFDRGSFTFSALSANARIAEVLACEKGQALFALDRTTHREKQGVTSVRLVFQKGYQLHSAI